MHDHLKLIDALRINNFCRIGIDGSDSSGKSTLAKIIGEALNISVISIDNFLNSNQGGYMDFLDYDSIREISNRNISYVIEGVCLLQVLERANIAVDTHIYVKRYSSGVWADERELSLDEPVEEFLEEERKLASLFSPQNKVSHELGLAEELIRYHHKYRSQLSASFIFCRDDD